MKNRVAEFLGSNKFQSTHNATQQIIHTWQSDCAEGVAFVQLIYVI